MYGGTTYGVKYDAGWDKIGGGTACGFSVSYEDPTSELLSKLAGSVTVGQDDAGHVAYIFRLPAGVSFIEGRPKDGTCQASPGAKDKCGAPVQPMSDGSLAFTACD